MSGLPELPEFHGVTHSMLIDYIKEQIRFSRQMTDYCRKLEARIDALENRKQEVRVITAVGGESSQASGPYSVSGTFGVPGGKGGIS